LLALAVGALSVWLAERPRRVDGHETEKTVVPARSPVLPRPIPAATAPPQPHEVRLALTRVFGDALAWTGNGFVAADFNGDGSADLAVPALPTPAALEALNSSVANWVVQDPRPGHAAGAPVEADVRVLAVIHGYGPLGWRDPQARQAYLLSPAAGRAIGTRRAPVGLRGDVIVQVLDGRSGYLYWTGFRYRWRETEARRR
jgi:hypothetical protein